ncbi:MAG: hypothetical protein JJU15_11960 [Pararhodobacter sp.]|nr:hypothetical protein [Pararhodobacter sp.]
MTKIKFAMGVVLGGLLSLPTVAEANPGRFMGGGTVFGFNQPCRDSGWSSHSEPFTVRYHPSNVGDNASRDFIGFLSDFIAFGYARESGTFSNSFQPVTQSGVTSNAWSIHQNHENAAQLRIMNMNPRNVNENTRRPIRIRGQIRNFSGIQGCNIRFEATVQQRQ